MDSTKAISKELDDDDKECPPGMIPRDGKCVPVDDTNGEGIHKNPKRKGEEDNAGDTTQKGEPTLTDASTITEPPENKECPPGTTLGEDGECHPTGDPAGQVGGGGTGDADTPGKESLERYYKMIEKLMASHTSYNEKLVDAFKEYNMSALKQLSGGMNPSYSKESFAYGMKAEASSMVDDSGKKSIYEMTVAKPAAFFEAASRGKGKGDLSQGWCEWSINPEAYFQTLRKGWMNYGSGHAHDVLQVGLEKGVKSEGFNITGGDMPQIFSKQVYLIPGGRMRVPIRQFLDTQIIEDADRFNWYKVDSFAFDGSTAEGSKETEESQTITKVTATPALLRALQLVNNADIENAPFDLIEAFNRAAALGSLDAEGTDVLDTEYDKITPTNWVESDGTVITEDDQVTIGAFQEEAIYVGMELVQDQGGDTSPGNMWAALHPKSLRELILDVTNEFWAGMGVDKSGSPRLMNTAMGVIENRLGVDIVATNQVHAQDNTTSDTFRNVLAMKGIIGLAVAADLQIEAQRRPDLSAVFIGARHRLKAAIIDETMTVRMSSAQ